MNEFSQLISHGLHQIQRTFFLDLEHEAGPIPETLIKLTYILTTIHSQKIPLPQRCWTGRPPKSRRGIFNAFVAKTFLNLPTTLHLVERLQSDRHLRLICGFETYRSVPSESVFSRVFTEFALSELLNKVHEELISSSYDKTIVAHVITDASAIEAREKHLVRIKTKERSKKRKKKPKEFNRIERQLAGVMTLEEMINDLPQACDKGGKTNSKGNMSWWVGYKIHLTVDDHGIPLAGLTTSASMHDSQAAIPLAKFANQRVINLYDLMDSGYSMSGIIEHSKSLGHVPIIERPANPGKKEEKKREKKARNLLNWKPAEMIRYEIRNTVERVFSRLKNEFGANFIRVRGVKKVHTHLMFGVLVLAADQLMRCMKTV